MAERRRVPGGLLRREELAHRRTNEQAAAMLGVHRATVYRWQSEDPDLLPFELIDGRRWVLIADIERLQRERTARAIELDAEREVYDMDADAIAAEYLCSVRKARGLLASGAIRGKKIAGEYRARRVDVERYAGQAC